MAAPCAWLAALALSAGTLAGCGSTPGAPDAAASSWPAESVVDRRARLLEVTRQQLGLPYRYGGDDRRGFDCSGLVQYAHASVGTTVPRTAADQQRRAQPVRVETLRPGDLVFFRIGGKGRHVGIYEGGGRFIHAPSSGKTVTRDSLGSRYWRERLIGAGSYL